MSKIQCAAVCVVLSIVFASRADRARAVEIPIFIIAGQSNAEGYGTDSTLLSTTLQAVQPNVLYAGEPGLPFDYAGKSQWSVNWAPLQTPTQTVDIASGHGFGPELMIGKTISAALGGATVGEVKFAVGGTSLYHDWNPSNAGGLYSQMLDRVNTAMAELPAGTTGKVAGFFWMQGEHDAAVCQTTVQYQENLTNLIGRVRADFGDPNLPFVFGTIDFAGEGTSDVLQAQFNVAATVPHTFLFNTYACQRLGPYDIHFNTQGEVDLGIGFAHGYLSIAPEPSTSILLTMALLTIACRRRRNYGRPKLCQVCSATRTRTATHG